MENSSSLLRLKQAVATREARRARSGVLPSWQQSYEGPLPVELLVWLATKGIRLRAVGGTNFQDLHLETVASMVAAMPRVTLPALLSLRQQLSENAGHFVLPCPRGGPERAALCSLCNLLRSMGCLVDVYRGSEKIWGQFAAMEHTFFLRGGWLEHYLGGLVRSLLLGQKYEMLERVEVFRPDGGQQEMDLLWKWNNKIFWLEVNTGRQLTQPKKHALKQMARLLGLPPGQACLVLTRPVAKEVRDAFEKKYQVRLLEFDHLECWLRKVLRP